MKKAVKALVIAASVAAVAGIGAISFARWTGTGSVSQDTTASTGEVTNFLSIGQATDIHLTNLLPYDQFGTDTLQTTGAYTLGSATFAITLEQGYNAYNLKVEAKADGSTPITFGGNDEKHTNLFATLTAPTSAVTSALTGWENVSDAGGYTFQEQQATSVTIYFLLDSNDNDMMNKDFKVTVSVEKANKSA
ncbi:MAG: hypothetical protein J1F33_05900 [Clostridiales bacterium]|nr:hypothetical protein [Clostridiales bacterium]